MDDGVKDNCNGVADNDVRRNGRQRWQDVDGDGVTGDNDNDDGHGATRCDNKDKWATGNDNDNNGNGATGNDVDDYGMTMAMA